MHAARGTVREIEAAAVRAAKRAACVIVCRRHEIARAGSGVDECGELVVVEQVGRHARAAVAAVVMAARPRRAFRARPARDDIAELGRYRELAIVHAARERSLLRIGHRRPFVTQPPAQRDQLVRPGCRVTELDQQSLDGNQHGAAPPYRCAILRACTAVR